MKKYFISVGLMLLVFLSSCFHNHDSCISISEDDVEFEMEASYRKNKTHTVQVYLDEHLFNSNSLSKSRRNEVVTLDDNTTFQVSSYPGELRIKFDKTKNSEESYDKVRQACEELKDILAEN